MLACHTDHSGRPKVLVSTYQKINKALNATDGASIQEHRVITAGVVRVRYDNGISIYINYNSDAASVDGVTVEGLNYAVKRG